MDNKAFNNNRIDCCKQLSAGQDPGECPLDLNNAHTNNRLSMYIPVLLTCLLLSTVVSALPPVAPPLLGEDAVWIVNGETDTRSKYSLLLGFLQKQGYKATIYEDMTQVPELVTEALIPNVNKVIILGLQVLPNAWTLLSLIDWMQMSKGSLVCALGKQIQTGITVSKHSLVTLFEQFGMRLFSTAPLQDPNQMSLGLSSDGLPLYTTTKYGASASVILDHDPKDTQFLYTGHGFKLGKERSKYFLWPVISASQTTFAAPDRVGQEICILSAFQSRQNSRASFLSSSFLLSDAYHRHSHTTAKTNAQSIQQSVLWTFKKRGMLKIQAFEYHSEKQDWAGLGTEAPKKMFRVLDRLYVQAAISKLDSSGNSWVPFKASDVQIEFTMLYPTIRATLSPVSGCDGLPQEMMTFFNNTGIGHCLLNDLDRSVIPNTQLYAAVRQMADRVGLFTLSLKYHRPGWSFLDEEHLVAVRQYAHNEYPRLIPVSYPYYVAMLSMMLGALVIAIVFLYFSEKKKPHAS